MGHKKRARRANLSNDHHFGATHPSTEHGNRPHLSTTKLRPEASNGVTASLDDKEVAGVYSLQTEKFTNVRSSVISFLNQFFVENKWMELSRVPEKYSTALVREFFRHIKYDPTQGILSVRINGQPASITKASWGNFFSLSYEGAIFDPLSFKSREVWAEMTGISTSGRKSHTSGKVDNSLLKFLFHFVSKNIMGKYHKRITDLTEHDIFVISNALQGIPTDIVHIMFDRMAFKDMYSYVNMVTFYCFAHDLCHERFQIYSCVPGPPFHYEFLVNTSRADLQHILAYVSRGQLQTIAVLEEDEDDTVPPPQTSSAVPSSSPGRRSSTPRRVPASVAPTCHCSGVLLEMRDMFAKQQAENSMLRQTIIQQQEANVELRGLLDKQMEAFHSFSGQMSSQFSSLRKEVRDTITEQLGTHQCSDNFFAEFFNETGNATYTDLPSGAGNSRNGAGAL